MDAEELCDIPPLIVSGGVGEAPVKRRDENVSFRQGKGADLIVSALQGRYYEATYNGRVFIAESSTWPGTYTNATAITPLLWNPPNSGVIASVLAVCFAIITATEPGREATMGLTGNTRQPRAPTGPTDATGQRNLLLGGSSALVKAYSVGVVTTAGDFLLPVADLHSGLSDDGSGLSVDCGGPHFIDVGGALTISPGAWGGLGASQGTSIGVGLFALIWAECPV